MFLNLCHNTNEGQIIPSWISSLTHLKTLTTRSVEAMINSLTPSPSTSATRPTLPLVGKDW